MRYKIFEMVKPEILKNVEPDGYHIKTIERIVLQPINYSSGVDDDYTSVEMANQAIIENKEKLKNKDLCILPIVTIRWDGEMI